MSKMTLADAINADQPKWMLDGVFDKGDVCVLASNSLSNLYLVTSDLIANALVGGEFANSIKFTEKCKVLYYFNRDVQKVIKRLQHALNTYDIVPDVASNFEFDTHIPQFQKKADTNKFIAANKNSGIQLLIVDVDSLIAPTNKVNAKTMATVLTNLRLVAQQLNCAVVAKCCITRYDGHYYGENISDVIVRILDMISCDEYYLRFYKVKTSQRPDVHFTTENALTESGDTYTKMVWRT